jgi:hypothetical protein
MLDAEAAVAMAGDKCQEVATLCTWSSFCRHLQDCLDEMERFVFKVKKLLNGIHNLKTVRTEAQNRRVTTKRCVAPVIVRNPLKANESWLTPARLCSHQHMLP